MFWRGVALWKSLAVFWRGACSVLEGSVEEARRGMVRVQYFICDFLSSVAT